MGLYGFLTRRSNNGNETKRPTLTEILVALVMERINSDSYKERSRKRPEDFTRKRKMTFQMVVLFMLMSLKCSTQSALRRFLSAFERPAVIRQQSYSEARQKIKPDALKEMFELTVPAMTGECREKWNGYRVYAVDGSKIALPSEKALAEHYGTMGRSGSAPTAQASILCDILNDTVADAAIEPLSCDERTLAMRHIDRCKDLDPGSRKLVIFDRGYPSFELIEKLENDGFYYVMRVRDKFSVDIDAQTSPDGYVWLEKDSRRIRVRVIKFPLDSGETETLITNVTDRRLGVKAFKKLYFLRWPVETKYDVVKNKLSLESFSSRTVEGIQQDFWATMFLANVAAAAAYDAQPAVDEDRAGKNNKYEYRVNINEAIGILKDRLILAFTIDDTETQALAVQRIVDEISSCVSPIRPNRSTPRKPPRNSRFHHNRKVNC
jgi:hypothetical protein